MVSILADTVWAGSQLAMNRGKGGHGPGEGPLGKQRKAGTSRRTGSHTPFCDRGPKGRQSKVGNSRNLLCANVNLCSFCLHYSKTNLANKKYASSSNAMTLWSRLNDKNLSSCQDVRKVDLGWKSGKSTQNPSLLNEYSAQSFSQCYKQLAKETHGGCSLSLPAAPEKVCVCVYVSHSVVFDSVRPCGLQPARFFCPWNSPGRHTWVGCHFLLQGIFPTQESDPGLLHCRQTLHCPSHQETPRESLGCLINFAHFALLNSIVFSLNTFGNEIKTYSWYQYEIG